MIIETNITVDLESGIDIQNVVMQINEVLRSVNGKSSDVNITDLENPIHNNPIKYRPGV